MAPQIVQAAGSAATTGLLRWSDCFKACIGHMTLPPTLHRHLKQSNYNMPANAIDRLTVTVTNKLTYHTTAGQCPQLHPRFPAWYGGSCACCPACCCLCYLHCRCCCCASPERNWHWQAVMPEPWPSGTPAPACRDNNASPIASLASINMAHHLLYMLSCSAAMHTDRCNAGLFGTASSVRHRAGKV